MSLKETLGFKNRVRWEISRYRARRSKGNTRATLKFQWINSLFNVDRESNSLARDQTRASFCFSLSPGKACAINAFELGDVGSYDWFQLSNPLFITNSKICQNCQVLVLWRCLWRKSRNFNSKGTIVWSSWYKQDLRLKVGMCRNWKCPSFHSV